MRAHNYPTAITCGAGEGACTDKNAKTIPWWWCPERSTVSYYAQKLRRLPCSSAYFQHNVTRRIGPMQHGCLLVYGHDVNWKTCTGTTQQTSTVCGLSDSDQQWQACTHSAVHAGCQHIAQVHLAVCAPGTPLICTTPPGPSSTVHHSPTQQPTFYNPRHPPCPQSRSRWGSATRTAGR